MQITRIHHIQLAMPSGEEDRARAFYSGILGLDEVPKPPKLVRRGGAWFAGGAASVHLGVDPDFKAARKAHPAFVVEDLERAIGALESKGVPTAPVEITADMRRTYIHDPFGNRIELVDGSYNGGETHTRS